MTASLYACFVLGCDRRVVYTKSWRAGTGSIERHACCEHSTLLASMRTAAGSPSVIRQGVLL